VSAREHASPQFMQLPMFVTGHELGEMASGDFGGSKVSTVRPHMDKENDPNEHPSIRHRGRPDAETYISEMKSAVDEQGGISNPVDAWLDHSGQPWLLDGTHRAQVAMDRKGLVPVNWHHQWNKQEAYHSVFNATDRDISV
jgi:hypothetical protein